MPEKAIDRARCEWLRHGMGVGLMGDAGKILGNCGLLGGTAYDVRCKNCAEYREVD